MCGIAGVVGQRDPLLLRMTSSLLHRGPDGSSSHSRGRLQISATRLAIIDPPAGADLIYNETKSICIAFNGEIYNHLKLREDLVHRGHQFSTLTDTEVIVHLYEEFSENSFSLLQGMFAFALCDRDRLLLVRDSLGIKPLYYTYIPSTRQLLFASEIKSILQSPNVIPKLDEQTLADFSVLSHAVGTSTFFEGIRCLAPGNFIELRATNMGVTIGEQRSYLSPKPQRSHSIGIVQAEDRLWQVLNGAVESHMAADVPVGIALSGGLDSTVLAFLSKSYRSEPLKTFTIADSEAHPDLVKAAFVAKELGADHSPLVVSFEDYVRMIPSYICAEEQPNRLYGMTFFMLCRHMSNHVKACLHGEGADELFGGYSQYVSPQPRITHVKKRLNTLTSFGLSISPAATEVVAKLKETTQKENGLQFIFDLNQADALERHHLDHVDRCSMAFGLEVRVPYLDKSVLELVNSLPLNFLVTERLRIQKYLLRRLCVDRFGPATASIVSRPKLGAPSACRNHLDHFNRAFAESMPDSYIHSHRYGKLFDNKLQLLVIDLFVELFTIHRGDLSTFGTLTNFFLKQSGQSTRCLRN